jgi:hypothetical protein
MTYVEIGATFLTTFLGVFLAFGLENYRQRRRTTAWVRRHLAHLLGGLAGEVSNADAVDGLLREQQEACTAWLTAQDGVTERQWELLGGVLNTTGPDFGALLRSEAITVLPTDLALALASTEYGAAILDQATEAARRAHEHVLPLWYDRVVPLALADRRRVERFRETLGEVAARVAVVREPLRSTVAAARAWLGPASTLDALAARSAVTSQA